MKKMKKLEPFRLADGQADEQEVEWEDRWQDNRQTGICLDGSVDERAGGRRGMLVDGKMRRQMDNRTNMQMDFHAG